ncbi:MAG: hypothetical protein PHY68_03325 [Proteiniphilum sp.]|nr:hypothetical protein [Proteiniphilum sp.]
MPGFFFSITPGRISELLKIEKDQNKEDRVVAVDRKAGVNGATGETGETETTDMTGTIGADAMTPEADDLIPVSSPEIERKSIQLQEGETLRILAEKLFGNREFWIYIYLENSESIADPNRVPAGIQLTLPDPGHYRIDPADPASVNRAKELGDQVLHS